MASTPHHAQISVRQGGLTSAEARFESAQKATRKLRDLEAKNVNEKTTRLRALRLSKEADEAALAANQSAKTTF